MPELPEVETTRRGIAPFLEGAKIRGVAVREARLRYPVTAGLAGQLVGQTIKRVERRGKYLLACGDQGTLLIHLGMSGSLRILDKNAPPNKHDHVDIILDSGRLLRYHDPRRFGAMLWFRGDPLRHRLLKHLGPEPLGTSFCAEYLYARSRQRRVAIKPFIMDSRIVVGVGNIYANEALFIAGIHPCRVASRVGFRRYECLVAAIKEVLSEAIRVGGTTLRDFVNGVGEPGYFARQLRVYGRQAAPCQVCGNAIKPAKWVNAQRFIALSASANLYFAVLVLRLAVRRLSCCNRVTVPVYVATCSAAHR